jgi:23S rRNA pseudouridine1911/1915/1917 synthase
VVADLHAGQRLDVFLTIVVVAESRSQLTRHITEGAVLVEGARAVPSRKVRAGEVVTWTPPAVVTTALVAQDIPLVVVHEDPQLIVIDKPPGLVVHPAPGHPQGTLVNALLARISDLRGIGGELRPGIVHRIDKDTSGLLVVAKDDATMVALGAAFKAHDIDRVYEALAVGKPPSPEGRIETLHGRDPRDRKKFSIKVKAGRKAITNWRVIERLGDATRIEAKLETGRTHQVRVHMASIGHPLLGDPVYGRTKQAHRKDLETLNFRRQALHAAVLGFIHPITREALSFESEMPADMQELFDTLSN